MCRTPRSITALKHTILRSGSPVVNARLHGLVNKAHISLTPTRPSREAAFITPAGGEPSETAMTRSATPRRPRTALFRTGLLLWPPVGTAQPRRPVTDIGSVEGPSDALGSARSPGRLDERRSLRAERRRAQAPRPAAPPRRRGRARIDVSPPNHWRERIQRVTFNVPPMTPLGQERAATPRLGGWQFHDRQFRRP